MRSRSVAVAPGAQHDERLDRLAPLLVGHADHRDLGHRGVLEQAVLDLDRRHVLAAGDDDVLLPVGDRDVRRPRGTRRRPCGTSRPGSPSPSPPAGSSSPRTRGSSARTPRPRRPRACARPPPGTPARLRRCARSAGVEPVPLRGRAVDGEQRRRLGEPVDLDELPARARSRCARSSSTAAARPR